MIAAILAAGLALRLWGIGYGLPFIFHPDENRQVLDALGMAERMSPIPEEFSYPVLHKYMLVLVNGIYFSTGRLLGWFSSPADFALKFLTGESKVFLLGRLLSAFGGTALGLCTYFICKRLYSVRAGFIGLAYSLGMFHLIQHSQWAIADIFLALFTAAALYFIVLSSGEFNRNTLLAFLFTGLAISTKPQGVLLLVPFAVSQFFALRQSGSLLNYEFFSKRAVGVLVLLIVSLLGNLSWLFRFSESFEKFKMLSQVAKLGISSVEPFTPGFMSLIGWFAKEMIRQETVLGFVLICGAAYALMKRSRQDLIFLSYAAVFMLALRDWAIRYLHLFVALFPVLCILAARFTEDFMSRLAIRRPLAIAAVIAVVLPSVAGSIEASALKSRPDTRLYAKDWIEINLPAGAVIAMDWYEFAVPVYSDIPNNLLNPKALKYYEQKVPERIRAGYSEFLKDKPKYKMLPVIYTTDAPNWPDGMDSNAKQTASSKEVYRELYSVFNFRSVEELKELGADYLIISSYGYTNFLLDNDPEKKGEFNYLFKEDLLSFNRQSDIYINDGKFGLLFYLNKRARDFYEPLLRSRKARLIKEFAPDGSNTGPIIKIYRLG
ncbi:MAG: glycosyltransferase family 39 protein [Deltaproteobacteria bacterium]|nr:glycosyltransferase family 39 protein [Deltaproteobacteria bacterium]